MRFFGSLFFIALMSSSPVLGSTREIEDYLPKSQRYPDDNAFSAPVDAKVLKRQNQSNQEKMSESARKPNILDDHMGGKPIYSTPNPNFGEVITELLTKVPGVAGD